MTDDALPPGPAEPPADAEFRFLADEAREFGIAAPIPEVRRDTLADRDGRGIGLLQYGTGSPDTVFLHGAGLNAHTWDATAVALGCPAVAFDLPGHGDSDWREDADYSPRTIAASLSTVLERLGLRCQLLVGQSLGGLAAAVIAARNPAAVRALVIVDITPGIDRENDARQVADFLAGPTDFSSREEIVERALAAGLGASRAATRRGVELNTRVRDDGRVVWKHHLANLGGLAPNLLGDLDAVWRGLEGLTVPVLLVRAGRGFLRDEVVEEFLSRVPGSRAVTIEGAGHNVQEDAPVELARAIAEFADRADAHGEAPSV